MEVGERAIRLQTRDASERLTIVRKGQFEESFDLPRSVAVANCAGESVGTDHVPVGLKIGEFAAARTAAFNPAHRVGVDIRLCRSDAHLARSDGLARAADQRKNA